MRKEKYLPDRLKLDNAPVIKEKVLVELQKPYLLAKENRKFDRRNVELTYKTSENNIYAK